MATLLRSSMTDHSLLDDTGDDINGSEVDENSYVISDILDGTTQTDLASANRVDFLSTSTHSTSREAIRLIDLDAGAAAVHDVLRLEWDPASGSPTNGQGIGIVWYLSDSVGNQDEVASLDVVATDVTSASEDYRIDWSVMTAGTVASELQLSGASLNPTTNDGLALGTTSLGFADLHLATGGVINWANGEVTLTETDANTLTLAGGNLALGTNTVTAASVVATTAVTANALLASSNDVGALGASGTAWSDLFLASGAVIDFNAGDVTVTHAANVLDFAGASTRYSFDATVLIGTTTANGNMTKGLTVDQATATNQAVGLKGTGGVAHGMTSLVETTTFGALSKAAATGGLNLEGYTGGTIAMRFFSAHTTDVTTKSTAGTGGYHFIASLKSGTSNTDLGANANIASFANNGNTRFILDGDGDSHQDVGTAWTNFDFVEDITVMDSLAVALAKDTDVLRTQFNRSLEESRELLESLPGKKIVQFNEDGHHFANMSRLTMVHHGAIRQAYRRIEAQEQELLEVKAKLLQLAERN